MSSDACYADWPLILDYLRVLWRWPTVTLIIVYLLVSRFHQDIRLLMGRLTKIQAYGNTLEATPQSSVVYEPAGDPHSDLAQWVKDHPEEAIAEHVKVLKAYKFERAHSLIFGTQVRLLQHLRTLGSAGADYRNLVPFCELHCNLVSKTGYPMTDYIQFLINAELVSSSEQQEIQTVSITPFGLEFLDYLLAHYPTAPLKPG